MLLSGCAFIIPQTEEMRQHHPTGIAQQAEITEVPFFPQRDFQCGPSALATSLAYFGVPVTADDLVAQVYLPERHGSLQVEMMAASRRHGLVAYQLEAPQFENLLREIDGGFPVIILQDFGIWPLSVWHYSDAVGYDLTEGKLTFRSGEKRRLIIPFAVSEYTWKESEYWAMVTSPPARIPVTATEDKYLQAVVALEHTPGQKEAARVAYGTMLERWPDSLGAGIGLSNAQYAAGELKQAETMLRRMVDKHPDAAVAYNNLAQTLLDEGHDADALPLAQRAVELAGPYLKNSQETLDAIRLHMGGAPGSPASGDGPASPATGPSVNPAASPPVSPADEKKTQ
jgi:tetratricopeptide (TPR) repeat protein